MWTLDSPDKELKVMVRQQEDGSLCYCVTRHGKMLIEESALGIFTDLGDFIKGLVFEKEESSSLREEYSIPVGKKRFISTMHRSWRCILRPGNRTLP